MQLAAAFWQGTPENGDLNQYWYSPHTIDTLAKEVEAVANKAAFLSTPSIYFALSKAAPAAAHSWLFDFDNSFAARTPNFFKYDFNAPEHLPAELLNSFDMVVIDPPFITHDVWRKYATTALLLLQPQGRVIVSTVAENADLLHQLLAVTPCTFKPSIPNLVYQYNLFVNYETVHLKSDNPEIPDDDG